MMIRSIDRPVGRALWLVLALLASVPVSARHQAVPEEGKLAAQEPVAPEEAGGPTEKAPTPLATVDESADLAERSP